MTEINEKSAFEVIEENLADLRLKQKKYPSEERKIAIIKMEKTLLEKQRSCKASAY